MYDEMLSRITVHGNVQDYCIIHLDCSVCMIDATDSFFRRGLSIKDQGLGIAPHEQGLLFQRFVRLERDLNSLVRGGGLYIARSLVEAMQGSI